MPGPYFLRLNYQLLLHRLQNLHFFLARVGLKKKDRSLPSITILGEVLLFDIVTWGELGSFEFLVSSPSRLISTECTNVTIFLFQNNLSGDDFVKGLTHFLKECQATHAPT